MAGTAAEAEAWPSARLVTDVMTPGTCTDPIPSPAGFPALLAIEAPWRVQGDARQAWVLFDRKGTIEICAGHRHQACHGSTAGGA